MQATASNGVLCSFASVNGSSGRTTSASPGPTSCRVPESVAAAGLLAIIEAEGFGEDAAHRRARPVW